ncbi:MAG: S8 family serine peptidase [Candidatus Pedobacter colombiensis]|uniref:S8 family serine peptidase n=1 Tax=Candidatus Pedobacter colombiensis TaxID=3121371 RepID=A0AAJ6B951_9SPHI|nr:S8 family serine peptidase [Pedobacter sp.]WEK19818.1 MAG: S8 family serine peptidase [Pedobacter sp.]
MKKLLLIIVFLSSLNLYAQEKLSFKVKESVVEFSISPNEYYVEFSEVSREKALQKLSLTKHIPIAKNAELVTFNDLLQKEFSNRRTAIAGRFSGLLTRIEPVLIYSDSTKQICTGELIVKIVDNKQQVQSLFKEYSVNVTPDKFVENQYIIKVNEITTSQLFVLAERLQQNENVEFAEPNFMRLLKRHTIDPYYSSQWSIKNQGYYSGTPGADMHVEDAWNYATGQNIKVAILDEGVDLNHPDLAANLLTGFDATGNGSNGAPNAGSNDAHGTACAGIVAAVANNNIGVAGIAYNAKVMPVRIAYSVGASWYSTDSWIADGIRWAEENGADILSNSWGGGSPSNNITLAINYVVNSGRNGKGCVVLFSTGNSNTSIGYPSTLSSVIAVGASSMCDERKTPTSCDGEFWWGSNYGVGLDVTAPGVKIYTTDISGPSGYNSGDYTSDFNGTSSACPNAAGVMALILSVNPNLTQQEARDILETTCDKVGGYTYLSGVSGQPNGTWSNDTGYGRINACAAVTKALGRILSISGPSNLCDEAIYTIPNLPAGATVTWSIDGWCAEISSSSGNHATVSRVDYGFFYVKATITTSCGSIVLRTGSITSGMPYNVSVEVYCEDGCGGDNLLCTGGNQYSYYNNIMTYRLNATPVYPVKLHYIIINDTYPNIIYQDSVTVSTSSNYRYLPKNLEPGFYNLEAWVTGGPCNESSEWYEVWFEVTSCGSYGPIVVYPNPSNTELKIRYQTTDKSGKAIITTTEKDTQNFSVKLLNKLGKVLKEGKTTLMSKDITLQVADLPNDTYFLHIYEGKNITKKQVVIWH